MNDSELPRMPGFTTRKVYEALNPAKPGKTTLVRIVAENGWDFGPEVCLKSIQYSYPFLRFRDVVSDPITKRITFHLRIDKDKEEEIGE